MLLMGQSTVYTPGSGITSAGLNAATSNYGSTYFGENTGGSSGYSNTFVGNSAGDVNYGSGGVFIGSGAGRFNTSGGNNIFIGISSGYKNTTSSYNTFTGSSSGFNNTTGSNNTFFGYRSGYQNISGSGNVFLGKEAGYNETGSNKLYIDNSNTTTPLVHGDFSINRITINGQQEVSDHFNVKKWLCVGASTLNGSGVLSAFFSVRPDAENVVIGTPYAIGNIGSTQLTNYKLYVNGGILAKEVRVRTDWADYVFDKEYKLKPLSEVETFIKENGHLPNVPSAKKVETDGIELGDITKIQQEKIEELTLYIIALEKRLKALEDKSSN